MIKNRLFLLIITSIFFAGCTMIPEYNRPQSPTPQAWPDEPAYKGTGSNAEAVPAPEMAWQSFFTDPRLQALIRTALENNRDLRVAALNVERARAMYRIQRSELLPTAGATGSSYKQRIPADLSSSGESTIAEEYRVELGIAAWEPDFFGRIRSLKQRALEDYFATTEARRGTQILLISEIANAWLALAADFDNLKLARSTLATQQAAYNLIQRRYEVGLATKLDLCQAQTSVDSARVAVARFTGQVARDKNALDFLAGETVPADIYPDSLANVAPMENFFVGTPSEVLLQRPDIRGAENALKAAYANIGAARAMLFPRITLTTAYGTASAELSGLFESGSRTWLFTPQISLPIFDPRTWSALKVRKVEREIALTRYEGTVQAAFRDVADTLAQKGTLGDQKAAQQSLVEAAAEAFRLSGIRYEKGTDIYLTVLDAQRSLYAAQQGLIAIELANQANQVRLYAVLGGGATKMTDKTR